MSKVNNTANDVSPSSLSKAEGEAFHSARKPSPLPTVIDLDDHKYLTKKPTHPYSGPTTSSKKDWTLLRSKWEDIQYNIPLSPESISTSAPSQASGGEGVHAHVQAHIEQEHTTRCGPQGEAHYSHWDPADHTQHKKYDEIYHKMDDQDPHDAERYEHIMHSPHVSTEAKLNAVDAMELPHTDQRCDLYDLDCELYQKKTGKDPHGLRDPDHPEQREKGFFHSNPPSSSWTKLSSYLKASFQNQKEWNKEKWVTQTFPSFSSSSSSSSSSNINANVEAAGKEDERVMGEIGGRREGIEDYLFCDKLKWVWVDD
ncbi:hypothetical protein JCM5350_004756 [Sporobolomyces pararoseus]